MAASADEGFGWPETLGIYVLRNTFCQFAGFVTRLDPLFGAFYPKNKVQQGPSRLLELPASCSKLELRARGKSTS